MGVKVRESGKGEEERKEGWKRTRRCSLTFALLTSPTPHSRRRFHPLRRTGGKGRKDREAVDPLVLSRRADESNVTLYSETKQRTPSETESR